MYGNFMKDQTQNLHQPKKKKEQERNYTSMSPQKITSLVNKINPPKKRQISYHIENGLIAKSALQASSQIGVKPEKNNSQKKIKFSLQKYK